MNYRDLEVWFITGAQLLYGGDAVVSVDAHSNEMVKGLNDSGRLPIKVVYKGTVNSSDEISAAFRAANADTGCIGVITWMHTFSPAKMWIHGLMDFKKPLLHLHTQYNEKIPWDTMDMDFMNLNQSAHGDREFGHITSRLRKPCKGGRLLERQSYSGQNCRLDACLCRLGRCPEYAYHSFWRQYEQRGRDRRRQSGSRNTLGYHVDNAPIAKLVPYVKAVTEAEIDALVAEYDKLYDIAPDAAKAVKPHPFACRCRTGNSVCCFLTIKVLKLYYQF